jgi:hypothetical protein
MGQSAGLRFANYIRRRNLPKAQQMVDKANLSSKAYRGRAVKVITWDGGTAHKRMKLGKLSGPYPVHLVCDYNNVKKYRTQEKKKVGFLKSGWADAAQDLGGTRGIPMFAKKGHKRSGSGRVDGRGGKAILIVKNTAKYILQNTSASKLFRLRSKNMEKVIIRMINRKGKKITKRV